MAGRTRRYQTRSRLRVLQVLQHDDNDDDSVAGESCDTISALLYIDVECKVTAVTGAQTRRLMLSVGMVQASEQAAVPLWDEGPSSSRECVEERVLWSVRWPTRLRPRIGFAFWHRVRTWIILVQLPSKN
ncbi:vacuolar membrane protein [Pseudozyma hubeiensis SY62]|uniref:Vacuolar membrane protein n=1 Tax=Pseudozyma hubeiensis (strain SY62) TaxID=1305764 RepID=R9P0L5_PSEHS|nr:vacuolar membrane protein [Pseudozyma hubeiensis SY62]GAC94592.1 vacuolar membrane protein [Pseudozyma hubeiensis SY62]